MKTERPKSTEKERKRWSKASTARRARLKACDDMTVYAVALSAELVGTALLLLQRDGGLDTADRKVCENLLAPLFNELLLNVIDDATPPTDMLDIVRDLKLKLKMQTNGGGTVA